MGTSKALRASIKHRSCTVNEPFNPVPPCHGTLDFSPPIATFVSAIRHTAPSPPVVHRMTPALTDILEEARLSARALFDYGEHFFNPTIRLGVTGLSRAGKTVFITALIHGLTR